MKRMIGRQTPFKAVWRRSSTQRTMLVPNALTVPLWGGRRRKCSPCVWLASTVLPAARVMGPLAVGAPTDEKSHPKQQALMWRHFVCCSNSSTTWDAACTAVVLCRVVKDVLCVYRYCPVATLDEGGFYPIHTATRNGNANAVAALCEGKCNVSLC